MTEKPILFSGPMVREILAGTKTQTRRCVDMSKIAPQDPNAWTIKRDELGFFWHCASAASPVKCPYDAPSLWVRETWRPLSASYEGECVRVRWAADGAEATRVTSFSTAERMLGVISRHPGAWRPSIYCERWASRLTLHGISIRVERLHDISEEDARAEGVKDTRTRVVECASMPPNVMMLMNAGATVGEESTVTIGSSARDAFAVLWDSINGKRPGCSWNDNPWVWVVSWERKETR